MVSLDAALAAHPATAETARSTVILAIDPGPERSAWLLFSGGRPDRFGIEPNATLLRRLHEWHDEARLGELPFLDHVVIEKVEGFGMAVGAEVFETVFWSGRMAEAAHPLPVDRIGRKAIKVALCGTTKAKDPNIRAALIDRFTTPGHPAIGTVKAKGPLYGISKDVWSALAVACAWVDTVDRVALAAPSL